MKYENHKQFEDRKEIGILSILLLAVFTPSILAQSTPIAEATSQSRRPCGTIITSRDAERCIGSGSATAVVPVLDSKHIYSLPELIDIAETTSPEGHIAWSMAKGALERTGIERARYLPLLVFVAQGSDLREIFPFPKPIAPRGYVTVEEPIALAELQLEYNLLDPSRGPRLDGSRALELSSTLHLGRVHQTIAYRTAAQYYKARQAIGQLAAARTIYQTAETLMENAQSQYDNGRSALPDVQNAQAGAAESRYELASAEGEVKKAKLALTEALGIEPTPEIEILAQEQTAVSDDLDDSVEKLIHTAWITRPDLLARAQQLRHAHDAYRVARAAYLPTVGLNAVGGQTSAWPSADWGQLGPANVSTWSVEATLKWEVFNGARRHEINVARTEQQVAAEERRASQDSVTREVWAAYVDYETALEQKRSSESFLSAAQISYDSSLDAYKYGVRSLVDVVQAERQLAQARLAVVRSNAQLMQSAVSLSYATGDMLHDNISTPGGHP